MPEPFKNLFSVALIKQMGKCFADISSDFDEQKFISLASSKLDTLELKERSEQIKQAMAHTFGDDFDANCAVLVKSLKPMTTPNEVSEELAHSHLIDGWAIMPMADYVADHGQHTLDLSMQTLYELTQRFSAEFAIRPFLLAHPQKIIGILTDWLSDPSHHVRRLISEGTRTRLPWGLQLKNFIADPTPVFTLLEALKDDSSEYVRRSVANNLNDLAKDHPDLVVSTVKRWRKGADKNRERLVKHGCRTLFKQGHAGALEVYGYTKPRLSHCDLRLSSEKISIGEDLLLNMAIVGEDGVPQTLMIDYVVYHKKANGKLMPKVFKWKTIELDGLSDGEVNFTKKHSFKPVTTRKYYSGEHKIALKINGEEQRAVLFQLM